MTGGSIFKSYFFRNKELLSNRSLDSALRPPSAPLPERPLLMRFRLGKGEAIKHRR
jgi:hypothetical protein